MNLLRLTFIGCFVLLLMNLGAQPDVYTLVASKDFKYKGDFFKDQYLNKNVRYIVSGDKGTGSWFLEAFNNETTDFLGSTEVSSGQNLYSEGFPHYTFKNDNLVIYSLKENPDTKTIDLIFTEYNKELELLNSQTVHSFSPLEKKTGPYVMASHKNRIIIGALTKVKKVRTEDAILFEDGKKIAQWDLIKEASPHVEDQWQLHYASSAEFLNDGSIVFDKFNSQSELSIIENKALFLKSSAEQPEKLEKLDIGPEEEKMDIINYSSGFRGNLNYKKRKPTIKPGTEDYANRSADDNISIYELPQADNGKAKVIRIPLSNLYQASTKLDKAESSLLMGELELVNIYRQKDVYYVHLRSHIISRRNVNGALIEEPIRFENHFLKIANSELVGGKHIKYLDPVVEYDNGKFLLHSSELVSKTDDRFRKENNLPLRHSVVFSQEIDLTNCDNHNWLDWNFTLVEGEFNSYADVNGWTNDPKTTTFYVANNETHTLSIVRLVFSK